MSSAPSSSPDPVTASGEAPRDAAARLHPPTNDDNHTVIKRYSNRKLYDTARSKYVTLDEIAKLVKSGEHVTIIDNQSKEDLTSVTLTQIILEEEKRGNRMPLAMLRDLIISRGATLQHFIDRSVVVPVTETWSQAHRNMEELREAAARSVSELTEQAKRLFNRDNKKVDEFLRSAHHSIDILEAKLKAHVDEVRQIEAVPSPEGDAHRPLSPMLSRADECSTALRARLGQVAGLLDELNTVAAERARGADSTSNGAMNVSPDER